MARILIVDDEPLIAMMAEDWLDELGHAAVGPAHDLDGALALVDRDLDAAILDLTLGGQESYRSPNAFARSASPSRCDRPRARISEAGFPGRPPAFKAVRVRTFRLVVEALTLDRRKDTAAG